MSRGEVCDGLPVESGRLAQRVEARNRVVTTHQPAKVECGALGRGDIHARHRLEFFGQQPVPASDYPPRRTGIRPDDFDRSVVGDPSRSVHRRGRRTRDHTLPARPQPCRRGPLRQCRCRAHGQVDVGIERAEPFAQLVFVGDDAVAQGLAADECLVHTGNAHATSRRCRAVGGRRGRGLWMK